MTRLRESRLAAGTARSGTDAPSPVVMDDPPRERAASPGRSPAAALGQLDMHLHGLLDPFVTLRVDIAPDCPACDRVGPDVLEMAVVELVRRFQAVMPDGGILRVQAGAGTPPSHDVLLRSASAGTSRRWLVVSVGSTAAAMPDLHWSVDPPRVDLASLMHATGGALSLVALHGGGVQLKLHWPGANQADDTSAEPQGQGTSSLSQPR